MMILVSLMTALSFQDIQEIPVEAFDRIDAQGGFQVELMIADTHSVRVEGPEDRVENLEVRVVDGELYLDWERRGLWRWNRNNRGESLTVLVTAPSITMLDISSAVTLNGSGLADTDLTLDISSAGRVSLTGTCNQLSADVSSAASLDTRGLECLTVAVDASSAAEAEVFASQSVVADASSAASVTIYGDPESVVSDTSSAGSVRRH